MSRTVGASRWRTVLWLLPAAAFLALLLGLPVMQVVRGSLQGPGAAPSLAHYAQFFRHASLRISLGWTLYFGLVPMLISLPLAIATARALQRPFRGRALFQALFRIPIALPSIVVALMALSLFDAGGLLARLGALVGLPLPRLVRDPLGIGVLVATAWKQWPYMTLIVADGFSGVAPELVLAARTLGAGRHRVFLEIELPLAAPAIAVATVLAFVGTAGSFAIPDLLGPDLQAPLAVHLVTELGQGHAALAQVIAVLLALIVGAVVIGVDLARRALDRHFQRGGVR